LATPLPTFTNVGKKRFVIEKSTILFENEDVVIE
jgi:hypothetical protein